MQHFYIDKYSELNSYIHKLDPRIKIISTLIIIFSIILTRPTSFLSFTLYALLITTLVILSRIPPAFIFKQSLTVIPFVVLIAIFIPFVKEGEIAGAYSFGTFKLTVTYSGLVIFWNILAKAYLSILCMIVLITSTKFSSILKALEKLRFPALFIMVLSFMYRYIFVIADELMKMRQAKESRSCGGSKWFQTKTLANMIGILFVRSYERSEFVYMAMCSRGFNGSIGTINDFQLKNMDFYFISVIITALTVIKITAG